MIAEESVPFNVRRASESIILSICAGSNMVILYLCMQIRRWECIFFIIILGENTAGIYCNMH